MQPIESLFRRQKAANPDIELDSRNFHNEEFKSRRPIDETLIGQAHKVPGYRKRGDIMNPPFRKKGHLRDHTLKD